MKRHNMTKHGGVLRIKNSSFVTNSFHSGNSRKEQIVGSCLTVPTHYLYASARKHSDCSDCPETQQPAVITNRRKEAQTEALSTHEVRYPRHAKHTRHCSSHVQS